MKSCNQSIYLISSLTLFVSPSSIFPSLKWTLFYVEQNTDRSSGVWSVECATTRKCLILRDEEWVLMSVAAPISSVSLVLAWAGVLWARFNLNKRLHEWMKLAFLIFWWGHSISKIAHTIIITENNNIKIRTIFSTFTIFSTAMWQFLRAPFTHKLLHDYQASQ